MWRALRRKAIADFASRPLQVVLLAVVVTAGVTSLTLSILVRESTSRSFESFLVDAHGGDAWIFGSETRLRDIARRSEVVEAGEPLSALDGGRLISTAAPYPLSFFGLGDEMSSVAPGVITSGRWPHPGSNEEAVIDRGLAARARLSVGDSIEVAARGGTSRLTVVGLVIPTSRAPYPVWDLARVFVANQRLTELGGGSPGYFAAGYVLRSREQAPDFVASVRQQYGGQVNGRAWQEIRDSVVEENDATFILLGVFAGFALGASIFVIANALASQAQSQRRDIGLLKAIGLTPLQVTALLAGETLALCILATGLGIVAASASAPLFLDRARDWFGSANAAGPGSKQVALTFSGMILLVAIATALPAWRAGRTSTISAIRGSASRSKRGTPLAARLSRRFHLPEFLVLAAKDLFAWPLRAWLTIAAIAVAAAAVTATMTIQGTLNRVASDSTSVGGEPFELEMEPILAPGGLGGKEVPQITHDEIVALIGAEPGVEAYLTRLRLPLQVEGQPFDAYAVGGNYWDFNYPLVEGRVMSTGDGSTFEAMVGLGMARSLGFHVGDAATFRVDATGQTAHQMTVVGIYVDNNNDGLVASFDLTDMRRLAPDIGDGSYGLKVAGNANPNEVAATLIRSSGGRVVVGPTNEDVREDVARIRDVVRPIMMTLSGFLFGLVALNLFSTLQLSIRERTREIGLLKALGFTPAEIVASIASGAMVLAAIGTVLGVPIGWLFIRFVFEMSAGESGFDAGAVVQRPEWSWCVALGAIALAVAAVGSALPARGAARLSVSEALRHE
jgi:putative ABC transport system permease protein